jgi:hypothetical protein
VLRERLAEFDCRPEFGCELTGFEQDSGGVTARVVGRTGEETIRAHYLVGADGGRSFVRQALDIGFPGKTLGTRAVVADLTLEGLAPDAWHRWNSGSPDQISICPLRGTELFQLQAPIPIAGEADLSAEGLMAMINERTGRADIRVQSVSWASAYSMNARLADRYQIGRVLLAGDAAHIHPPTGGQGLNTSVQDAYNLGWKLAAVLAGAPVMLLETYEAERRSIAAGMLGLATKLLDDLRSKGEIRRGRDTQQLDIGYLDSPLSRESPVRPAGLRAGDRAPDARCHGASAIATRLFTLFQGPHWTLLGYDVDRTAMPRARGGLRIHIVGECGDVVDEDGNIRKAYGLESGDWVLIRPDGYIGALFKSADAGLEDYLKLVGEVILGVPLACSTSSQDVAAVTEPFLETSKMAVADRFPAPREK